MKKLFCLIAILATIGLHAQTISLNATAEPGGALTVTWNADFNGQSPAFLTIGIVYGRTLATANSWAGVYGWSYWGNVGIPIELQGTRTIYPPSWMKSQWALVIGNICMRTGPEIDDYYCIEPAFTFGPVKLKK